MAAGSAGGGGGEGAITVGMLRIEGLAEGAPCASFGGRPLDLTRRELELLRLLVANNHRVLSRGELSRELGLQRSRSIDVLLSSLRRVLGCDFVRNVPKRGWILVPEALEPQGSVPALDG